MTKLILIRKQISWVRRYGKGKSRRPRRKSGGYQVWGSAKYGRKGYKSKSRGKGYNLYT